MNSLTYLASPYSHDDRAVRCERFEQVCVAAGRLLNRGEFVFSPIAHSHHIAELCELPKDWKFWADFCNATLGRCTKVAILMLDGWRESTGVTEEIKLAETLGLPVVHLDPNTLEEVPTNMLSTWQRYLGGE